MSLEVLNVALVLFRRLARLECAQVAPFAGFRVLLSRVQSIPAVLELSDHPRFLHELWTATPRGERSGILRPPLNRPEVLGYEPSAPRTSTRSPRGSRFKPCREDGRSDRAAARGPWSADRRRIGCSTAYRLFGRSPRGTRTIDKRRILRPPRVSPRFASFHFRAAHACAKNARCRLTTRAGVAGSPGPKGRTQKAR